MGYLLSIITLVMWGQSIHILKGRPFIHIKRTWGPLRETISVMKPLLRIYLNYSFNSLNTSREINIAKIQIDWVSGNTSILKSIFQSREVVGRSMRKTFVSSLTSGTNSNGGVSYIESLTLTTWWIHQLETNILVYRYKMRWPLQTKTNLSSNKKFH